MLREGMHFSARRHNLGTDKTFPSSLTYLNSRMMWNPQLRTHHCVYFSLFQLYLYGVSAVNHTSYL
jgi:hypothetical protein